MEPYNFILFVTPIAKLKGVLNLIFLSASATFEFDFIGHLLTIYISPVLCALFYVMYDYDYDNKYQLIWIQLNEGLITACM